MIFRKKRRSESSERQKSREKKPTEPEIEEGQIVAEPKKEWLFTCKINLNQIFELKNTL